MSENEQDFDALRRLLALKRHEVPPPGYFEDFSGNVIARIRAGEAAAKLPWILRFLQLFESRPAYPVVFASSLFPSNKTRKFPGPLRSRCRAPRVSPWLPYPAARPPTASH
jgi:hypothetical protein